MASMKFLVTISLLMVSSSMGSPAADSNGVNNSDIRRSGTASDTSVESRDKSGKRDDGDVPRRGVTFHRDDDQQQFMKDDRNRHQNTNRDEDRRRPASGSGITNGIISDRSPLLSATDYSYGSGFQDYDPYYGRLDGDFFRRYWDRYGRGSYDKFYDRNNQYRDPSYRQPNYYGQSWNRNCYYGGYGCKGRDDYSYNRYDDRYRQDDSSLLSSRFRYARMFFPQNTAYRLRGRDVQLRCIFPGATVRGKVSWYPPGRELDLQYGRKYQSYESAETAILEIKDFERSDFGTYRCYATINRGYDNYRSEEVYQDVYFHPTGYSGQDGRYDDSYYRGHQAGNSYGTGSYGTGTYGTSTYSNTRYNDDRYRYNDDRYRYTDDDRNRYRDDDYGFAYSYGGDRTRYRYMDRKRRNLGAKSDGISLLELGQQQPILITNSGFSGSDDVEERSSDDQQTVKTLRS